MHPADIKAALEKKGKRSLAVAKACGCKPSVVSQVIHGKCHSRKIATRISAITGIPVSTLWPGQYPRLELAEIKGQRYAA